MLAAGYDKTGTAQADAKAIADALAPSVASVIVVLARRPHEDRRRRRGDRQRDRDHRHRPRPLAREGPAHRERRVDRGPVALAVRRRDAPRRRRRGCGRRGAVRRHAQRGRRRAGRDRGRDRDQRDHPAGPGLVAGLSVEPRLLPDQLWPQLFQVARASGTTGVAAGIDVGTALRVQGGTRIRGRRQRRGRHRRSPGELDHRRERGDRGRVARARQLRRREHRRAVGSARGGPSVAARRHHGERQRQPATLLGPHVAVPGPPVHRVLRHALEAKARAEQRRDDLAQRPRPGELQRLVVLGDREAVDVLGRPAARRLGARRSSRTRSAIQPPSSSASNSHSAGWPSKITSRPAGASRRGGPRPSGRGPRAR